MKMTRMPTSNSNMCRGLIVATSVALFSFTAAADDALLIGGGHEPLRSEGQIELNVIWVQEILTNAGIDVTTWFTDGNAPGFDVYGVSADSDASDYAPLARVFGDRFLEAREYKENDVQNVAGSTDVTSLLPALTERLNTDDDPVLLVYNGHGSQSSGAASGVTLNLWNNTTLSARELHENITERTAPLRWVFTQCYSGGFHRLAYDNPDEGLQLTDARRCGFTAESAYQLSEGCSASLDTGDYRDYTTYFFAALSGRGRDGDVLGVNPDSDGDGITTPREAHFYTLAHAYSSDLSRSTSEDYLDEWQPWYLRWLPLRPELPDNEYAKLYRDTAAVLGIPLNFRTPKEARSDIDALKRELSALQEKRRSLHTAQDELQGLLIHELASRWPPLLGPYTAAYIELVRDGSLDNIVATLTSNPDYTDLVLLQEEDDQLDDLIVESERAITQRLKLLRLRRLAHLVDQLERHGSDQAKADYASLVGCESEPLR